MSAWDAMNIAKLFPGKFDVPYVTDMNISAATTGVINSSLALA